jgi:hypothetical protein
MSANPAELHEQTVVVNILMTPRLPYGDSDELKAAETVASFDKL